MALQPLMDRVIVKPLDVTDGPIILPEGSLQGRPGRGKVLATGPGHQEGGKWIDLTVMPGDIVLYSLQAGLEITIRNEKCLIMREFEIYAVDTPDEQEKPNVSRETRSLKPPWPSPSASKE